MRFPIPDAALAQHTAVLGKTGSGKTSVAKAAVEHLVVQGARVCVLDPIKSDWWGLTSSADGKKPGLPFQILGGPRGHVPLHPTSGKVIAELVASGALPLCILDMADFPPGGLAQFFNDFAPTLLRKMKGVVHLVMEEAHEFAPKERAGIGNENMLIHHAKKLATAGRSRGLRLILATQRIQALHNALLGSCDTMVALRLTAPADQKPVVDWLKANLDKDKAAEIAASLSKLKTGSGWVCSGDQDAVDLVHFPRIKTYDNSATPEAGALGADDVRTAQVDIGKLRELVGAAVAEAEANDPKALKVALATANAELAKLRRLPISTSQPVAKINTADQRAAQQATALTIKTLSKALEAAMKFIVEINATGFFKAGGESIDQAALEKVIAEAVGRATKLIQEKAAERDKGMIRLQRQAESLSAQIKAVLEDDVKVLVDVNHNEPFTFSQSSPRKLPSVPLRAPPATAMRSTGGADGLPTPQRRVLASIGFWASVGNDQPSRAQVGGVAGYSPSSGGFNNILGQLNSAGLITIPAQGRVALAAGTPFDQLTLQEAQAKVQSVLSNPERKLVDAMVEAGGGPMTRDDLGAATDYSPTSGGFNNLIGGLCSLTIFEKPAPGMVSLSAWAKEVLA